MQQLTAQVSLCVRGGTTASSCTLDGPEPILSPIEADHGQLTWKFSSRPCSCAMLEALRSSTSRSPPM